MKYFEKSNLLVTGGTGSFGKMFIRVMQADYHPQKLIVFSRDEPFLIGFVVEWVFNIMLLYLNSTDKVTKISQIVKDI